VGDAKTVRKEILPYVGLDGFVGAIRYRSSTNNKYQEIRNNPASIVVSVDDLRSIPRHELALVLDNASLPKQYASHLGKLSVVIVVSDATIRNEHVMQVAPLSNLPESFVLDSKVLKRTSCRTELPVEISICASEINGAAMWPARRASRLASWRLTLVNESKGPKFPWVRKTAEEFKAANLPQTSTFFVSLTGDPEALLTDADADVADLLEVWVHEDVWVVLQQAESTGAIASVQRMFVSQVAMQMFNLTLDLIKKTDPVEGSVMDSLMRHMATVTKIDPDEIRKQLKGGSGLADLGPLVTATFGVNRTLTRLLDLQ